MGQTTQPLRNQRKQTLNRWSQQVVCRIAGVFGLVPAVGISAVAVAAGWHITAPPKNTTYVKTADITSSGTGDASTSFHFIFRRHNDGAIMQSKLFTTNSSGEWVGALACPPNGLIVDDDHEIECRNASWQQLAQNDPIIVVEQ